MAEIEATPMKRIRRLVKPLRDSGSVDAEWLWVLDDIESITREVAVVEDAASEAARVAFMREMAISFAEFCIGVALWGMFGVARERLFKEGVLLSKEQFMGIGFKTMLPPLTLLRIGMAGWTYSIVQEPPLIPRPQSQNRPARETISAIGLG